LFVVNFTALSITQAILPIDIICEYWIIKHLKGSGRSLIWVANISTCLEGLKLLRNIQATCSVDIATGYGLGGPGSKPGGGKIFGTCPDRSWGSPSLLYNGYRVFLWGKNRPGYDADPSPLSSAEVYKQCSAIPLLSLRAFVACRKSETYLE
jgi:hypothetical protein